VPKPLGDQGAVFDVFCKEPEVHFRMTWKNTGVKKIPNKVTPSIPKKTAVPRVRRISAPAPSAMTSGSTPRMNAKEVMMIGRNRTLAASTAAS